MVKAMVCEIVAREFELQRNSRSHKDATNKERNRILMDTYDVGNFVENILEHVFDIHEESSALWNQKEII